MYIYQLLENIVPHFVKWKKVMQLDYNKIFKTRCSISESKN